MMFLKSIFFDEFIERKNKKCEKQFGAINYALKAKKKKFNKGKLETDSSNLKQLITLHSYL